MKTEELFESGVTPLEGPHAGERLPVKSIDKEGVVVISKDGSYSHLKDGEYKIWEPEKNLLDDTGVTPTWGNLKKTMEDAGVSDDALFVVRALGILPALEPAAFDLAVNKKGRQIIVVY